MKLVIIILFFTLSAVAQDDILDLKSTLGELSKKIQLKESQYEKKPTERLESEINDLIQEKKEYQQELIETIIGVSLETRETRLSNEKRDLIKELQELVTPIFDTLKRASERPRKIEKLKNEIYSLDSELKPREEVLKKLKLMSGQPQYVAIVAEINEIIAEIERENHEMQAELSSKERQLKKELGEKKTFYDEFKDIFSSFMKTRGKNLLIFILIFGTLYFIILWSRRRVFKLKLWKRERFAIFVHPLRGVYGLLALALSFGGALCSLYILHDWVLVTLFLVIVAGIIWSLKRFLPRFFQETKLILNLGTVKEGERVLWNNIPWRVVKLGFSTHLRNEMLEGASIYVASKDLIKLYSRPIVENEPWFPTKVGDWILINEKALVKVISQTTEQVVVERFGGTREIMRVEEFFLLKKQNLSQGFFLESTFELDHCHKDHALGDVLFKLKEGFELEFKDKKEMIKLTVEFQGLTSRAIQYYVSFSCVPELANRYFELTRLMQKSFLEICHREKFKIAVEKLFVSMENK